MIGVVTTMDGLELAVSAHAFDRFRQRMCPRLHHKIAFKRLISIVGECSVTDDPPEWVAAWPLRSGASPSWIVLNGETVLLVDREARFVVTTVGRRGNGPRWAAA